VWVRTSRSHEVVAGRRCFDVFARDGRFLHRSAVTWPGFDPDDVLFFCGERVVVAKGVVDARFPGLNPDPVPLAVIVCGRGAGGR
jgi:hypothetical protein